MSLWVHAATASPPHRKYVCLGTHPTASKQSVVWGTGKKVVDGYSSTQRGIRYKICKGSYHPSPNPPAMFFIPSLQAWGFWKNMLGPLTEPSSSDFHSPLCKLGGSGAKHVRARPTPIEPPAVIFTLFSVAWGPHPLAGPRSTRPNGSGHAHHPRRPGVSLTFMQEHRI